MHWKRVNNEKMKFCTTFIRISFVHENGFIGAMCREVTLGMVIKAVEWIKRKVNELKDPLWKCKINSVISFITLV